MFPSVVATRVAHVIHRSEYGGLAKEGKSHSRFRAVGRTPLPVVHLAGMWKSDPRNGRTSSLLIPRPKMFTSTREIQPQMPRRRSYATALAPHLRLGVRRVDRHARGCRGVVLGGPERRALPAPSGLPAAMSGASIAAVRLLLAGDRRWCARQCPCGPRTSSRIVRHDAQDRRESLGLGCARPPSVRGPAKHSPGPAPVDARIVAIGHGGYSSNSRSIRGRRNRHARPNRLAGNSPRRAR